MNLARPSFYQMIRSRNLTPQPPEEAVEEADESLLTLACLLTGTGGTAINDARMRNLEVWMDAQL
jgi:hypothetical protein